MPGWPAMLRSWLSSVRILPQTNWLFSYKLKRQARPPVWCTRRTKKICQVSKDLILYHIWHQGPSLCAFFFCEIERSGKYFLVLSNIHKRKTAHRLPKAWLAWWAGHKSDMNEGEILCTCCKLSIWHCFSLDLCLGCLKMLKKIIISSALGLFVYDL